MIDRPVTLGGPPGGGKSTAGRRLADRLQLRYVSAGDFFRADARERGLSVEEYSRYAELHPEVDRELDHRMAEFARPGFVLDGRIQGPLARRRAEKVHDIIVTAEPPVRAARVAQRDRLPVEEAACRIAAREASERDRYLRLYGIDLATETADWRVDSTRLSPEAVVESILRYILGATP